MNDIHAIKPIIETPLFTEKQMITLGIIGSLIFGIIAFGIGFAIWKKYFQKEIKIKTAEKKTNYKADALSKIRMIQWKIEKQEFKAFYLEITEIVKWYLSKEYNIKLEELTTQEIIDQSPLPEQVKKILSDFLHKVDEAKFANQHMKIEIAKQTYKLANKLFI